MSKVKLFACHKTGHYAGQCPNKKKGKKEEVAASAEVEFAAKFTKEFSLYACLSGTVARSACFVDSCASHHMMGSRDLFTSISEVDSEMHVECSVDTKHAVKGVGTVLFQLESGGSLKVADVLYVPKLKMNLL
jgi:hypothetical protein